MPTKAGDYEIRYVLHQGRRPLAITPISITEAEVSISAPDTTTPGALITIDWVGPDASGDFISVAKAGADDSTYISYVRTNKGPKTKLRMPDDEGEFEIRYVLNQGRTVLARHIIKVAAP